MTKKQAKVWDAMIDRLKKMVEAETLGNHITFQEANNALLQLVATLGAMQRKQKSE